MEPPQGLPSPDSLPSSNGGTPRTRGKSRRDAVSARSSLTSPFSSTLSALAKTSSGHKDSAAAQGSAGADASGTLAGQLAAATRILSGATGEEQLHGPSSSQNVHKKLSDLDKELMDIQRKAADAEARANAAKKRIQEAEARAEASKLEGQKLQHEKARVARALEHAQADNSTLRVSCSDAEEDAAQARREVAELLGLVEGQLQAQQVQKARAAAAERTAQRVADENAILRQALEDAEGCSEELQERAAQLEEELKRIREQAEADLGGLGSRSLSYWGTAADGSFTAEQGTGSNTSDGGVSFRASDSAEFLRPIPMFQDSQTAEQGAPPSSIVQLAQSQDEKELLASPEVAAQTHASCSEVSPGGYSEAGGHEPSVMEALQPRPSLQKQLQEIREQLKVVASHASARKREPRAAAKVRAAERLSKGKTTQAQQVAALGSLQQEEQDAQQAAEMQQLQQEIPVLQCQLSRLQEQLVQTLDMRRSQQPHGRAATGDVDGGQEGKGEDREEHRLLKEVLQQQQQVLLLLLRDARSRWLAWSSIAAVAVTASVAAYLLHRRRP